VTRAQQLAPLVPERIPEAYPLVRLVRPDLSLAEWRARARLYLDAATESAGIMTLQQDNGLMLGLYLHRIARDPIHGPTLLVEDFVAAAPISGMILARPLAQSLDALAHGAGCRAIHTVLRLSGEARARDNGLACLFHDLGHRWRPATLCKTLDAAATSPGTA